MAWITSFINFDLILIVFVFFFIRHLAGLHVYSYVFFVRLVLENCSQDSTQLKT